MDKIFVCENSKNPIRWVKREFSAAEKVTKSNQVECIEEIVKEHVCESGHTRDFQVLVQIDRADRGE